MCIPSSNKVIPQGFIIGPLAVVFTLSKQDCSFGYDRTPSKCTRRSDGGYMS